MPRRLWPLGLKKLYKNLLLLSSCSALPFRLLYNLCILYPCRLIILLFVASPRVAPLEPHVEEQNVGALVSSQEEHRVVDSPLSIFAAARLPLGSSLLYSFRLLLELMRQWVRVLITTLPLLLLLMLTDHQHLG